MTRVVSIAVLVFLVAWLDLPRARADALADFERAEIAYREQRYAAAATILEGVIATAANDPVDQAVVLESRKYLGACYLFLDRVGDAERQFELLLELDPGYRVDPVVFPHDVVDRFEEVRHRVEAARVAEREAALHEAEARLAAERHELLVARTRYSELYDYASTSLVLRTNSRIVAFLPFGIGQFQNGNRRRGRLFAISEGILLGTYFGAFVWHERIRNIEVATVDQAAWQRQMDASRILNWTSGIGFLSLTIAGAIEAEVKFVPVRESTRVRPVPDNLRPDATVTARLVVAPTALSLRLDW